MRSTSVGRAWLWGALFVVGCADGAGVAPRDGADPDAPVAPDGAGWAIDVDTSGTRAFVALGASTARVSGTVRSSRGIGVVRVDGLPVAASAAGAFTVDVPVAPGLRHVEIEVSDTAVPRANSRRADRTLLVSDFLPEGAIDPVAASLVLTSEVVGGLASGLTDRVASIDVASEIMRRPRLTDDDCVTVPTSARHGTPELRTLVSPTGQLLVQVIIPSLEITFEGECRALITSVDVTGRMSTDVVIQTALSAPPSEACVEGLEHTPVEVQLLDFELQVQGASGGLLGLLVGLFGGGREGAASETLRAGIAGEAETLLGSELSSISVLDSRSEMELFGRSLDVHLCLTGLVSDSGQARALVGAEVRGEGGLDAPGAPFLPGELPAIEPGTLQLDANLVAQLLFSAWRAGALSQTSVMELDLATLSIVAPELRDRYPAGTRAQVDIDGRLPALVRAVSGTPGAPMDPVAEPMPGADAGDLLLELGELDLVIRVGEEVLFRVGNDLRFALALVPTEGGLRPEVVRVEATTWVREEPVVDANDLVLAGAVQARIGDAALELLGDAVISLPAIGGAVLRPTDVTPVAGGRYVAVALEP